MEFFIFAFLVFMIPNGEVSDESDFLFDFVEVLADQLTLLLIVA